MNYSIIYEKIISRSKGRNLDCYTERHHVIPRCMGGTDDINNIAILTAREHFLAHWLLYKIYRTKEMAFAWNSMCRIKKSKNRYTSRSFSFDKCEINL